MNIEILLEKKDYLIYQLYTASKSKLIIKSRNKLRIRLPIVYILLAIPLYLYTTDLLALVFILMGILWYFISPFFMKGKYRKHYEKYLEENYKNQFGKKGVLNFEEDYIVAKDDLGEGKYKVSEIIEINEIAEYFFLKLSSGQSLIIPKQQLKSIEDFNKEIQEIVKQNNFQHNIELNWEWK